MSGDETDPEVPVACPRCGTTTRVPLSDVADAVARHNEQLHDGEDAARVDPDLADRIADLVVDDLDLLDPDA